MRLLATLLALLLASLAAQAEVTGVTTFYLVRHAEKQAGPGDVELATEGHLRTQHLLEFFRNVALDAVYSTDYSRTRQTAQPVAGAAGLSVQSYPATIPDLEGWAKQMVSRHKGGGVLLVGHSNTVPELATALSGVPVKAIGEHEHDNLFVVTVTHHKSQADTRALTHHHYGLLPVLQELEFETGVQEGRDLSAVVVDGSYLVVGADEGDSIQILKRSGPESYRPGQSYSLGGGEGEIDIEGMARQGATYYVAGSHSHRRKKVSANNLKSINRKLTKNRQRLSQTGIRSEESRDRVFRFSFRPGQGEPRQVESINLRTHLQADPVLAPFSNLPSKENGIDIEGLVNDGKWLLLGFRAPVLREGYVPVMRLRFENPSEYELRFVHLHGRGIRDIVKTASGFLILAGPVGDSNLSYRLYHWDGKDCLPGRREQGQSPQGKMRLLGTVPTPQGGKAEALEVLKEGATARLLVIYDGVEDGGARLLEAPLQR